ncbi:hypothetical protein PanWU01x14_218710 [Parasponia andersonii]|uniref:Uncharacterized protein n=1 Tax=Parasponia andersonii TaxID=3476 RepID=A0A2P5BQT9_PARAD|nr:hypothetical protein PanWU01x14_218710 [Parasponia andersonii]
MFIWHMHMGYASKDSQVGDPRLPSAPCFLWCLSPHTSYWRSIRQVNAHATASTHNSLGNLLLFSMLRAMLKMVRFFLSATPFVEGILEQLKVVEFHLLHRILGTLLK